MSNWVGKITCGTGANISMMLESTKFSPESVPLSSCGFLLFSWPFDLTQFTTTITRHTTNATDNITTINVAMSDDPSSYTVSVRYCTQIMLLLTQTDAPHLEESWKEP